jgi:diadenosine tetraphosphate (Ap4A) HIT family hydrolase
LPERTTFDTAAYLKRMRTKPCFVCALLAGDPEFAHPIVYEDEFAVAFLNKYPPLKGYTLVCPKAHLEQVTGDFSRADYLRLQSLIHEVSEALRTVLEVERVYILSLGSQQGNRHVHWHLAPLPPGVPFEDQQFAALDLERTGVLAIEPTEQAALAESIAEAIRAARAEAGIA